jgi:hypothetical protein
MMTMTISKEVLDELLSGVENADDLLGNQGLMKELKVRLMASTLTIATAKLLYCPFPTWPSTHSKMTIMTY